MEGAEMVMEVAVMAVVMAEYKPVVEEIVTHPSNRQKGHDWQHPTIGWFGPEVFEVQKT